ncbi:MAG: DUF4185 domain-containing protein [Rhodospirillaceae bacterium]|nr:DUF4185 domain-containing protein [Rhodospirillales bacterium]
MQRIPLMSLAFAALVALPDQAQTQVTVDHTATAKICQVTGEVDRSTGQPTVNATERKFRFWGTDLGASFEHDGKTVYLFGDTHAAPGLERKRDRDMVALSTDTNPEDCLKLDVVTDADGGYRPLSVAGVDGGEFSVPTGGFSANGAMYVVATTDKTATSPMGRSVLAKSSNGGRDFQPQYDLSTNHFITVAPVPANDGKTILLFGSGTYRTSDVHLAVLPQDRADDLTTLRYFAGTDANGAPKWSDKEADSAPLLNQSCVGELSVAWNADLNKWVMLYNCGAPKSQILVRTADQAWGPWSAPQVLFDASADKGFRQFMHDPDGACPKPLSDPHSPQTAGDPYAPYMIAKFARGVAGSHSDIYFLMSTWNPYNVVLMKARLQVEPLVS